MRYSRVYMMCRVRKARWSFIVSKCIPIARWRNHVAFAGGAGGQRSSRKNLSSMAHTTCRSVLDVDVAYRGEGKVGGVLGRCVDMGLQILSQASVVSYLRDWHPAPTSCLQVDRSLLEASSSISSYALLSYATAVRSGCFCKPVVMFTCPHILWDCSGNGANQRRVERTFYFPHSSPLSALITGGHGGTPGIR